MIELSGVWNVVLWIMGVLGVIIIGWTFLTLIWAVTRVIEAKAALLESQAKFPLLMAQKDREAHD